MISVILNFFIIESGFSQIGTAYSVKEARNTFYLEIAGNGLVVSANYERSLYKNIGFRVGVGYIVIGYSIPTMINLSIGKTHKLEIGPAVSMHKVNSSSVLMNSGQLPLSVIAIRDLPGGLSYGWDLHRCSPMRVCIPMEA